VCKGTTILGNHQTFLGFFFVLTIL